MSHQLGRACYRLLHMLAAVLLAILLLGDSVDATAQNLTQFFELANPQRLDLRLFASGYGAEKYGTTHEGFELSQRVTGALGIVGRISGYQIYQGTGFDSPLVPSAHRAPHDFGRFGGTSGSCRFLARASSCWAAKMWGIATRRYSKMTSRAGSGCTPVIHLISHTVPSLLRKWR